MSERIELPERFNVADHFLLPPLERGWGERPVHLCGERRLTYAELNAAAHRVAHVLRKLGIEPEQRVALALPDSLDFPPCFWGTLRAGAVAIPLNTQLPAESCRGILADSRARALIVDGAFWERLGPAVEGQRHLRHVIAAGEPVPGVPALETLLTEAPASTASEPLTPDDPAFWLYTSGSTGVPKAAVHLHHDMVHPATHFARNFLGLGPDDLSFSASKLFFAYGLGNSLYFPPATGGCSLLMPERPTPEGVFAMLARHRPTVFYAVPTLYNALLNLHERWVAGEDAPPDSLPRLEHLRLCVSAGEPLPAETFRRWQQAFGHELLDGIGSTEMLQTFLSNPPGRARPGSTGVVIPGYEARVVDEQGREVPDGEPGELWARGDSSAPAYWNRREPSRRTMVGGWVVSGDRFRRDAEGYFWYEGRADDMFKVSGQWVSPPEVENVLLAHAGVAECAVVAHADGDGLIRPRAHVVPRPGHVADDALAGALLAHVAGRLPRFKTPAWVAFHDELPKTATGKIRRFLLRA